MRLADRAPSRCPPDLEFTRPMPPPALLTRGPGHEADTGASLSKVSATFDALVRDRGVFEATRVVVGLLFDSADADADDGLD